MLKSIKNISNVFLARLSKNIRIIVLFAGTFFKGIYVSVAQIV